MPTFEELVRPFQLPEVAPPKQGTEDLPQIVPPVRLWVGTKGQGRVFKGSYSYEYTLYTIKYPAEQQDPNADVPDYEGSPGQSPGQYDNGSGSFTG
jgi:hypothetical protein